MATTATYSSKHWIKTPACGPDVPKCRSLIVDVETQGSMTSVRRGDKEDDSCRPTEIRAVFIANLRGDITLTRMKDDIVSLLQSIGVQVCCEDVYVIDHIVTRDVMIYVDTEFEQRRILELLQLATERCNDRAVAAVILLTAPDRPLLVSLVTPKNVIYVVRDSRNQPVCRLENEKKCYVRGERVGCENRSTEFKLGQGSIETHLADCVSKYISAFLNSEGGTLMIGVTDKGEVLGVPQMDQEREDKLRQRIDIIIRGIVPAIFPGQYTVRFVPVTHPETDCVIPDVKVIEICTEPGSSEDLYQTQCGDVYIRRDGSVQGPLKAAEIQEWIRVKLQRRRRIEEELLELRERERILTEELEVRRVAATHAQKQLFQMSQDEKELKRIAQVQMEELAKLKGESSPRPQTPEATDENKQPDAPDPGNPTDDGTPTTNANASTTNANASTTNANASNRADLLLANNANNEAVQSTTSVATWSTGNPSAVEVKDEPVAEVASVKSKRRAGKTWPTSASVPPQSSACSIM